jgi:kanamycin kinase
VRGYVPARCPGRVWDAEFFTAYEVEPDPTRMGYCRRLWQAVDIA